MINSDSNFIYIANNNSGPAIANLVTDLNKKSKKKSNQGQPYMRSFQSTLI